MVKKENLECMCVEPRLRSLCLEIFPVSQTIKALCPDDRPLSNCQHHQIGEDWPPLAICRSVKGISYVSRELNKVKHLGDVYMQIKRCIQE